MAEFSIQVENIKCSGCAHSIVAKIKKKFTVNSVAVNISSGTVIVDADPEIRPEIATTLKSIGYPEVGSVSGIDNLKAKAVSFASCAVGNMNKQSL